MTGRAGSAGGGRRRTAGRLAAVLAALLLPSAVAACGGRGLSGAPSAYGAPTPEQAVRVFLQAANREAYPEMGRHFGTKEGPAERRLGVSEVEQRMVVLAGLLRHDSLSIARSNLSQPDPRRTRYMVTLGGTRYGTVTVPVFAVRSQEGRWFVERIVTDRLGEDLR